MVVVCLPGIRITSRFLPQFLFHFDVRRLFLSHEYFEWCFWAWVHFPGKEREKRVLIKSLLTYSKECKKSWRFHLTVLIEMTDMWYTEWHFLRCVFEVFFFMVIHAVRSRQAGSGKVLWLQKEILKQLECMGVSFLLQPPKNHNEHWRIFFWL